ncbi:hypothetical protein CTEN210_13685 [Chaetoceros tenuissimus]|uniref:Leucine-rich repeat domain-containing protein n=1 Tax=Chaetoceros tenuissimus TaxID=426638 RepID=A0AAD3D739_9STRA|nr:hypothetical protein CTEN210_13685 [Chaetoceros tenuissimus]
MRVATVDGLVTLFYDGSKPLYNSDLEMEWLDNSKYHGYSRIVDRWEEWDLSDDCKRYWRERQTWQQVIVVEGVVEITEFSFRYCKNIKRVIMADTVIRIEEYAFNGCKSLAFIKWSINIEVIEYDAFYGCNLSSVFIPPRCRVIGVSAFMFNRNLALFHVPQDAQLGDKLLAQTKLIKGSPFELDKYGCYDGSQTEEVNNWIKNINNGDKYSLHRACSSFQPLKEVLMPIVRNQGIGAFHIQNDMGITPSQYLKENPYTDMKEMDIVKEYLMTMMGELE